MFVGLSVFFLFFFCTGGGGGGGAIHSSQQNLCLVNSFFIRQKRALKSHLYSLIVFIIIILIGLANSGSRTCDFFAIFNSISLISGRWVGDNERPYAMEPHLLLKKSSPQSGLEPGISQRLTQ